MDKRIIKTKTNIKNAFMELCKEMEMSKISISDLAKAASINRSTFYLHYADVKSVAQDIENEYSEKIEKCLEGFNIANIYTSAYTVFKRLTKMLDEKEISKNYIIYSTNSDYIISRIKDIFAEKTKASLLKKFPGIPESKLAFPLIFAASGIVDSYVSWVKANTFDISLEDFIREISAITEGIISDITANIQGR